MRTPSAAATVALALAALPASAQVDAGADRAEWSYAGPTAPEHWTDLGHPACAGALQSPVDLQAEGTAPPLRLRVAYSPWRSGTLYNNGHSVVLRAGAPGTLWVDEVSYAMAELHFHVQSEHTVRGHRFAGEAHLVHASGGARAVLGTLIVEGAENPAWNALIRALPGHEGERVAIEAEVDLVGLLGLHDVEAEWIFAYAGSLTTPPCDQNVRWLVRAAPLTLSRAQIDALSSAMVRNARPLQRVDSMPPGTVTLHRGQ